MNILFIIPSYSSKKNIPSEFPLGPAYVMASVKASGFPIKCINLNFETQPLDFLLKDLYKNFKFEIVLTGGLSVHYNKIKSIKDIVRKFNKEIKIIIGGGLVTSMPAIILEDLKPDFISIGEGEINICEILKALENKGKKFSEIKGIGYFENGEKIITRSECIVDIDSLPFPEYNLSNIAAFLKIQKTIFRNKLIMPVISSRGCPYKCTFCFHTVGDKYRYRNLDGFFREIEYLIETYHINTFIVYDELLSANKERFYEFCHRINYYKVKWVCQLRVDVVTEDILKLMKQSGCFSINYGLESASDRILKSMKKNITKKIFEKTLTLTRKSGIGAEGNFIFGNREETFDTAMETLDWWKQHNHYCLNLGHIIPYPGTDDFLYCVRHGIIKDPLSYLQSGCPVVNMTKMENQEYRKFLNILSDTFKKYKFSGKILNHNDGLIEFECPHCKAIDFYTDNTSIPKILCNHCNQWSWIKK